MGGIFSWHTLRHLVPMKDHLNTIAYLGIAADHMPQFMFTINSSSGCHFQEENSMLQMTNNSRLLSYRVPLGCGGKRHLNFGCVAKEAWWSNG